MFVQLLKAISLVIQKGGCFELLIIEFFWCEALQKKHLLQLNVIQSYRERLANSFKVLHFMNRLKMVS